MATSSKALMTSRTHSSTSLIPSPEASPYSEDDRGVVGAHKGWSSERVPLSGSRARRHVAASALMPFSSGRALPSKWDDAERWISSPLSVGNAPVYYTTGVAAAKASHLAHRRRTKSKSGPLGQAGLRSYNSFNTYSPVLGMGVINGGQWRNSVTIESPALVRARLKDELVVHGDGDVSRGGRRSCPAHDIDSPDWLDLWSGPPSPTPKGDDDDDDENIESSNDNKQDNYEGETRMDRAISRRDMATQMFADSDQSSSPSSTPRSSISTSSPRPLPNEPAGRIIIDKSSEPEFEVRDVQVDKQTSTAKSRRSSPDRDQVDNNPTNSSIIEADRKILSKLQREEDKINAWENLQKAKAEAAIRKLEMKLEKKRSSSMEKIIEKLRRAETKAQKMRSSLSKEGDNQIQSQTVSKGTSKIPSFCKKIGLSSSTKSCSTCYPF